jgi:hypothetical protein
MFQGLYPNHSLAVHLIPLHFLFQLDRHHRMIEGVSTHVDETQQRIDQMTAKVEKLLNNMGTVFFVDAHNNANMSLFSHSTISSTRVTRLWAMLHGFVTEWGCRSIVTAHHIDID